MITQPHATLLYHYFHPDDVVSARLFSELAVGLRERGWDIKALPCNRGCREETIRHSLYEQWNGIDIERVWRPNIRQASTIGRLLNAAWMLGAWSLLSLKATRKPSVMLVGTDPILSVLTAIPWSLFRRRTAVAHWCHDLYPEAPIANGMIRDNSLPVRIMRRFLRSAYGRCGLIADLGICMRNQLGKYGSSAKVATLTPWSLIEPSAPVEQDLKTRRELFGDAKLGLLYSGNFGRAHSYSEFLELARMLRDEPIGFCFAARGNRMDELKAAVQPEDHNIRFAGFAPEAELEKRLGACDMHLVSLRPEWTGTVVPSKFFGALATGRGVLFAGSPDSAIARWIDEYDVGQVITSTTIAEVADSLRNAISNPHQLSALKDRCFQTYQKHFSRKLQIDRWDKELRSLIPEFRN